MLYIVRIVGIKLGVVFIIMSTTVLVDIHQIVYIQSTQHNALVITLHLHEQYLVVTNAINRGIMLSSVATCQQSFQTSAVVVVVVVAVADMVDVEICIVNVVLNVTTRIIQPIILLKESLLYQLSIKLLRLI